LEIFDFIQRLCFQLAVLICWPLQAQDKIKPNILFLFADDFCYEALGCLRQTDIETPNLDWLAARGTTFTHAYYMGSFSGAVCGARKPRTTIKINSM
jgi:hypothetical protein